jgi:hypothetical protein
VKRAAKAPAQHKAAPVKAEKLASTPAAPKPGKAEAPQPVHKPKIENKLESKHAPAVKPVAAEANPVTPFAKAKPAPAPAVKHAAKEAPAKAVAKPPVKAAPKAAAKAPVKAPVKVAAKVPAHKPLPAKKKPVPAPSSKAAKQTKPAIKKPAPKPAKKH